MEVPVLDFSSYVEGPASERERLCKGILENCATFGFMKLVNHGIPDKMVSEVFDWSRRYFELPEEVKRKSARPSGRGPNRGWSSVGQEKLSGITGFWKGVKVPKMLEDAKESFDQGPEDDLAFPNLWPPEHDLTGFRSFMKSFYDRCHEIHMQILRALEVALQLESPRLTSMCARGNAELRLTHYPPIDVKNLKSGKINRISEHTDLGTLTMLFQDSVGGLEVEDQSHLGQFLPLESASKSEMIVNIGDTLQRWTNDTLCSVNHRVTIPVQMKELQEGLIPGRLSVGFFGKANRDESLRSLPEFLGSHESLNYEDITASDYYKQMQEKTYPTPLPAPAIGAEE